MVGILDWLRELITGVPQTQVFPAQPLPQYPTPADAQAARAGGFGYGTPADAYIQGQAGRVYGGFDRGRKVDPFIPAEPSGRLSKVMASPSVNLTGQSGVSMGLQQNLMDVLTQAALATNYVPVAAVGFDPRNITLDASGRDMAIHGAYAPSTDQIMAMANEPSAITHESIHRGLYKMMGRPELAAYPGLQQRMAPGNQEDLVRWLMMRQAGDPEGGGSVSDAQKARAKINPPSTQEINVLNALAAQMMQELRPRGPR